MISKGRLLLPVVFLAVICVELGSFKVSAAGQSASAPGSTQLTAEQQKQLDQFQQQEAKLQQDRTAIENAVAQYGWDSDEADAAQEQFSRDRVVYRQLRHSLVAPGVSVPPASGFGPRMGMQGRRWIGHCGHGHHGGCWDDDCCHHGHYDGNCSGGCRR